jgi:hypothetical protein
MAAASPYGNLTKQVNTAMDELVADESHYVPKREAEELFILPNAVQIFFVRPDGKVSTFSEPSTLRIFRFKQQEDTEEWIPTFIQVGGWTHPLIPGASPVLEAGNGAFMFPDVYADDTSGSSIGIVLADEVDQATRDQLRKLLDDTTALKSLEQLPKDQQLGTIGRSLVKGAELFNKGLDFGAAKACELIEYTGETQKSKMGEPTDQDAKVGNALKYSIKGVGYATFATVKVSGFVAKRVGKLTKGTANYLAKKIEKPVSGAVVGSGGGMSKSSSMQLIIDAARGGLIAYGTVYAGLEDNAKVLGKCVKDESVDVMQHKYGEEAGGVYGEAMTAAGNAAMTYLNVSSLGFKGLVKRTAKDTAKGVGKGVLETYADQKKAKVDGAERQESETVVLRNK